MVRDLKEPLDQFTALNLCTRSPTLAVNDLLVRENGHINRVPVHDRFLAVDQALFKEIDEQRLLLAVILRITGREFT